MTPLADAAITILQLTNDGENLDPSHLKLVELAINGMLSPTGEQQFADLVEQVQKGYVKPWFHGVEHITRNHQGFVFWKGVEIEHYSHAYANTPKAAEAVQELQRRCLILEGKGITPDTNSVIWRWKKDKL